MTEKLYVAYGSNLNMEQMAYRCPDARPVAVAEMKDCKLTFRGTKRGTGVATVEKCKGEIVPIGIWKISEYDEMFLDVYEGFPHLYRKEYVNLEMDGQEYKGLIYIMTEGHILQKPSAYYAEVIRDGYYDFGLDTKVLNRAIAEVSALDA